MAVDTTGQSVARLREYHEHRAGDLCFLGISPFYGYGRAHEAEESYSVLRAFLKERQRTLKSLDVVSATAFAFEFYRNIRAEGTSPLMGDGMAWNCDIIRRSNGSPYEFSLVRLLPNRRPPLRTSWCTLAALTPICLDRRCAVERLSCRIVTILWRHSCVERGIGGQTFRIPQKW